MPDGKEKKLGFIVDVVFVAFILAIIYVSIRIVGLIYPFFIAVILVGTFQPLIKFIHAKAKINQKTVSLIIMALLYVALGFLIVWLVIQTILVLRNVFTSIPEYYSDYISPAVSTLSNFIQNLVADAPEDLSSTIESIEANIVSWLTNLVGTISQKGISLVTNFVSAAPAFLVSLVFTILLSFFVSIQYDELIVFIRNQLPAKKIDMVENIIRLAKSAIGKYLKAIGKLMLITFTELTIGLLVLRIPNVIGIAAGIAIFDAFPVLGTGGVLIPWAIIELIQQNYPKALGLIIMYAIVTLVRQIIEPKIVGDQLGINPVLSLISIYLGYRIWGVGGMILFPIIAQILMVLHHNGTITLYKEGSEKEKNKKSSQ